MASDTITLHIERYNELIETENFMRALEAAGVDSWEGYEIAIEGMEKDKLNER